MTDYSRIPMQPKAIDEDLVPKTTGTKSLGSSVKWWQFIFATILILGGSASISWISAGGGYIYLNETTNITSDLIVSGNITAENVFKSAYLFAHTDTNITSAGSGFWHNITFADQVSSPKNNIRHDNTSNLNDTFIINEDGVYNLNYYLSFADIAPSPEGHITVRVIKNNVEVAGSLREKDTFKQNADTLIGHGNILVDCSADDEIIFQFATDDTTITLSSHATYGTHKDTAIVTIERVS